MQTANQLIYQLTNQKGTRSINHPCTLIPHFQTAKLVC